LLVSGKRELSSSRTISRNLFDLKAAKSSLRSRGICENARIDHIISIFPGKTVATLQSLYDLENDRELTTVLLILTLLFANGRGERIHRRKLLAILLERYKIALRQNVIKPSTIWPC
jgi:hypothetical protein